MTKFAIKHTHTHVLANIIIVNFGFTLNAQRTSRIALNGQDMHTYLLNVRTKGEGAGERKMGGKKFYNPSTLKSRILLLGI